MKEKAKFTEGAIVKIQVIDKETGKVIEEREEHNLIVNKFREHLSHIIGNEGWYNLYDSAYIKIGTNGVAPTVDDTDLASPYRTQTANRNEWNDTEGRREIEALFTDFTETVNICESGMFSYKYYGGGYSMKNRVTFPYVTVDPTKNLKVIMYFYPNV